MKYTRPPYDANDTSVSDFKFSFGNTSMKIPRLDYPISIKENFKRCYTRSNPVWVPNSLTDFNSTMIAVLTGAGEADWSRKERYDWRDWFDVEWTFVPEAGGPMLKPGTQYLDDITKWETGVKFPELKDYDIKGLCEKWMKESYNPEKITHVNIGLGCTERLVSLLGGYSEAMCAMALEPEAVRAFLDAFAEFEIKAVDELLKYVPIDMITYHDDWGTERDTFFSPQMMEDMVFEPTCRLFGHIKSKGICLEHHCCGNIKRFMPYMIRTGADFMQLQARANDLPALKEQYGGKIGFNAMIMPEKPGKQSMLDAIHRSVKDFAKGGGYYTAIYGGDQELFWDATQELFYYSREYYEGVAD